MEPIDTLLNSIQNNVTQVEVLSHNVANANTPGFQATRVFAHFHMEEQARVQTTLVAQEDSAILQTDRALDVAILNEGYLLVERHGQQLMTRHGRLHIDHLNRLTHSSGALVVGEAGSIHLPQGLVQISQSGKIMVDGEHVDTLLTVSHPDSAPLQPRGLGLFHTSEQLHFIENRITQGAINGARVDVSSDMVQLIELSRHTQSLQKAVHALDQIANAGINELGKK